MTDYKEEQSNEIEALESIYPEELELISTDPFHSFEVTIKSQCTRDDAENATCVLKFTYTATYPDEAPVIEISSSENIDEDNVTSLMTLMKEQAEENLGMVMVFTLISAAQEKLTDLVEKIAQDKLDEEEQKLQEKEEAERKKFEGTRLTVESFLAWKAKFDAEIAEMNRLKGKVKEDTSKLTGKELFMRDHTLDDSDIKFLEGDGDTVDVDESLFQDLDDLDLDEDGLEDLDNDTNAVAGPVKS